VPQARLDHMSLERRNVQGNAHATRLGFNERRGQRLFLQCPAETAHVDKSRAENAVECDAGRSRKEKRKEMAR